MNRKLLIIGLDVDDKAFHGFGICKETGESVEFATRPYSSALNAKFEALRNQEFEIKCCYEACHFGFSLARDLIAKGWKCEVIAPTSIPRRAGDQVKTDRIDARKLTEFYLNGQLTVVHVPDAEEEGLRDFIMSCFFANGRKVE